jgi:hypothetical protein
MRPSASAVGLSKWCDIVDPFMISNTRWRISLRALLARVGAAADRRIWTP